MARIRTVKPELFSHEELYEAEKETGLPIRVAFIGLFTCADREGRFKWRPRTLKLATLPHDELDFSRVLDALTTRGFVVRYASETGEEFGYLPTFCKHQVINNRESASDLPDPDQCLEFKGVATREPRVTDACSDACPTPAQGKGKEGKGKEGKGKEQDACPTREELPDWIPEDAWLAFVAMRKKIRAPLTDDAVKLAFNTLEKLMQDGHKPRAVLDQSTLNSWRGLFEIKSTQQRTNGHQLDRQAFNDIENARAKALLFGPEVDHAK